jgi:hypothetical protein
VNIEVGFADAEGILFEGTPNPLKPVPVVRVPWITERFEEVVVAMDAADVLRRTCSPTGLDEGIKSIALRRKYRLKDDVVLPTIAEIVLVGNAVLRASEKLGDRGPVLADSPYTRLATRDPVEDSARLELVQMAIGPAHDRLKAVVQPFQWDVRRHEKASPNGRL